MASVAKGAERVKCLEAGTEVRMEPFNTSYWTDTVKKPCDNPNNGHWYCVTHQVGFRNVFDKADHIDRGRHDMIWWCHDHGPESQS